jgi:flagellin
MSSVLNTNVASLWASKYLQGAQTRLATSVERLASGLRINRARDDAAGLGVASSLTAQINGVNQGIRNLNDAVSSMQTGEGAIAAAQEMGQRMLMLATQAANSTLGQEERTSIRDEMRKLIHAIDAIGGRTTFAGNPLLSYDASQTVFYYGTGPADTSILTKTLGASMEIYYSMQISNSTADRVALNSGTFTNVGGIVADVAQSGFTAAAGGNLASIKLKNSVPPQIEGERVYKLMKNGDIRATNFAVAAKINSEGTEYSLEVVDDLPVGDQVLEKIDATTYAALSMVPSNAASITDEPEFRLLFGNGLAAKLANSIENKDLLRPPGDVNAPPYITEAWQKVQDAAANYVKAVTAQRAKMGAYQNQLEYTLSNITELSSNLSSARSRVIDTDYASETAALTRGQILQQAATAMLAQANQMPNVILTLLK